jgi:Xaa-Pro dipeptidase
LLNQYSVRLSKLQLKAHENQLDGVIVVPGPNLRYYTGGNSLFLERPFFMAVPADGEPHLVAPTLESGPYLRSPLRIIIHSWTDADGPSKSIEETASQLKLNGKWGLDGGMPYRFIDALLKLAQPQFENAEPILQNLRSVKDAQEVRLLTRSAKIISKSFLKIPRMLKAGMSELELAQKVAGEMRVNGAESTPDVLVQSGPMAADGHHLPTERKLRRKESVVVDATCTHGGYFADLTRTFMIGRDPPFERLYENVLEAEIDAVEASRAGVTSGSIDGAARECLRRKGLDTYFVHRTGHGLGLEVHEAPYIVPGGLEVIQPGMAFTIEPGAYMQGKTGIRIEDDLISTEKSSKVLTKAVPKSFGWWN